MESQNSKIVQRSNRKCLTCNVGTIELKDRPGLGQGPIEKCSNPSCPSHSNKTKVGWGY